MNPATAVKDNEGFEELTAPELLKWEKVGQELRGIFRSLEEITIIDQDTKKPKQVQQYLIEAESGSGSVKFFGPFDLLQKLTRKHVGCVVKIKYIGNDESASKNGNAMKVFSVWAKSRQANTQITDDDLPDWVK